MTLLSIRDLRVSFTTRGGTVRAVDGIGLDVAEGEVVGLVGESGSGKSATALAVMGLVPRPPGRVQARRVSFRGEELLAAGPARLRSLRGAEISMIFQDPMTSLNPLLTVERQLTEVLETHEGSSRREARVRAVRALGEVGIAAPEERLASFPHELSGGMRQRVMIAMALLCRPALVFADEPTTALDVTIQSQILELLRELQARHGTATVLITHDLGVVAGMADRVHVMYAGRIVEEAPTRELYARPLHPYTRGLLASVPRLEGDPDARLEAIPGQPPDPAARPSGCSFAPRCAHVVAACEARAPALEAWSASASHRAACLERERLAAEEDGA